MSTPSKQVSSRRLPPISNGTSPHNRSRRNESAASNTRSTPVSTSSTTPQENSNEKRKYRKTSQNYHQQQHQQKQSHQFPDIENAFQQGPFRFPLQDISPLLPLSPPSKQNKPDPIVFLHGIFSFPF